MKKLFLIIIAALIGFGVNGQCNAYSNNFTSNAGLTMSAGNDAPSNPANQLTVQKNQDAIRGLKGIDKLNFV